MSVLALVPARGASKSIPRKNVKPFLGRPLIAWTIESALAAHACARVVVSTDDEEIAAVARAEGAEVPFLRPAGLATDDALTGPVVRHAVDWLREHEGFTPVAVLVLEPTSPGRRPEHVREAAGLLLRPEVDSIAGVSPLPHVHVKALAVDADGTLTAIDGRHPRDLTHRRQDVPVAYAFNGISYGCKTAVVMQDPPSLWGDRVLAQVVDPRYAIDLDRPEDWAPGEARLRELLGAER